MADPNPVLVRRYPRSLFGPLVLIGLGVLFLLGNMGVLTWARMGRWFAQYWPVLIIIWGVFKLLEYFQARQAGMPYRGIGVGGAFLLFFLIVFGMAASQAARVNWHALDDEFEFGPFLGERFEYSDQLEHEFPAGASLRVTNERGDVRVLTGPDGAIKVGVRKVVYAENESEARKINDQTRPSIRTEGNVVVLDAQRSRNATLDLEITVPARVAAELTTLRGAVEARGLGDVKAHASRGSVTLEDLAGNANVHLRHGDFRASRVTGDVVLEGRVDDSTASDIGGVLSMSGDFFGTMKLNKIGKGVRFNSSRTELEFARLDGDMTMDIGNLSARTLVGPFRLQTRSKDVRLEDFTGELHLENRNAEIRIQPGRLPLSSIDVQNRRGNIELVLPANAQFQLDARADNGEIRSQFEAVTVDDRGREVRATGSVGTGGARLQLSSEHGRIEIRKAG